MTSMYSKLALSSQPGWGAAFIIGDSVQVFQQSLFWLVCKGASRHLGNIKLDYFLDTEVVSSELSLQTFTEILESMNIIYFVEESGVRWLLPHVVSAYFYAQWKNHIISELKNINVDKAVLF